MFDQDPESQRTSCSRSPCRWRCCSAGSSSTPPRAPRSSRSSARPSRPAAAEAGRASQGRARCPAGTRCGARSRRHAQAPRRASRRHSARGRPQGVAPPRHRDAEPEGLDQPARRHDRRSRARPSIARRSKPDSAERRAVLAGRRPPQPYFAEFGWIPMPGSGATVPGCRHGLDGASRRRR